MSKPPNSYVEVCSVIKSMRCVYATRHDFINGATEDKLDIMRSAALAIKMIQENAQYWCDLIDAEESDQI